MTSSDALNALKKALQNELEETCTSVSIFINSEETVISVTHRTTEQLKSSGISMKNIQGKFIN